MASERGGREDPESDGDDGTEASHEPRECMPCRGKGQVISNLGGTPSNVSCPWCGGSGVRSAEIDAQGKWLGVEGEGGGGVETPAEPSEPAA